MMMPETVTDRLWHHLLDAMLQDVTGIMSFTSTQIWQMRKSLLQKSMTEESEKIFDHLKLPNIAAQPSV